MSKALAQVPAPLFEDIARGAWIPIIGSGLSRNAVVSIGEAPPDWNGLAHALKAELMDPGDTFDAVDVISAYAQEHGRPALVERIARTIRLADSSPAPVHQALCRLPLDVVMTTNFDTLLEDAFRAVKKPCHAVLDEPQLSLNNPFPGPTLIKIHGDVSRPDRMVLTEGDFDTFLLRNPLLATIIASHFAQRSVVLIGYSLSDPDLRQLLGLVRERLGEGARAIYAIEVDASPSKIARFARRHVKVLNLPLEGSGPGDSITRLFTDLYDAIGREASARLVSKTHQTGLAIRAEVPRRSCFLATNLQHQPNYHEWLGPLSARLNVPLLTFQDFVAPGESAIAAVDSMLAASGCAIVEVGSTWTASELGMAINRLGAARVLVVSAPESQLTSDAAGLTYVRLPQSADDWAAFGDLVEEWWSNILGREEVEGRGLDDAHIGEVITLAISVENLLGDTMQVPNRERTLGRLIREAEKAGLMSNAELKLMREFSDLRNKAAHSRPYDLTREDTSDLLARVREFLARGIADRA